MTLLNLLLTRGKALSLSDSDIRRICHNQCRIVMYNELVGFDNVYQLFEPYNHCILFYSTTSNFQGHWVSLVHHEHSNTIEYFDSYGLSDRQLVSLAQDTYSDTNGRPILTELFEQARAVYGAKIVFNTIRLQSSNITDVATCGRYAALRCRCNRLTNAQFVNLLTDKRMSSDNLVVLLTAIASGPDLDDAILDYAGKK